MSSILRGISAIQTSLGVSLSNILPHVIVEEEHSDEVVVTDHPVQRGAPISDHMYRRPSELKCTYGWSDSPQVDTATVATVASSGAITSAKAAYAALRALQSQSCMFTVITGKRTYSNMILRSIRLSTTEETENSAVITLMMREVILADVTTVSLAASTVASAAENAATVEMGTKSLQQVGNLQ